MESTNGMNDQKNKTKHNDDNQHDTDHRDDSPDDREQNKSIVDTEKESTKSKINFARIFGPYDPLDPLHFPSIFTDDDDMSNRLKKFESFAETLWETGIYNAGRGLLELRSKFPFLPHVIYSLMKGRTLLVTSPPRFMGFVICLISITTSFLLKLFFNKI